MPTVPATPSAPTLTELIDRYLAKGTTHTGATAPAVHSPAFVVPWIDGRSYFNRLSAAIDSAVGPGDRIYIVGWELDWMINLPSGPSFAKPLVQRLATKAAQGVDVRVILWANRVLADTSPTDDPGAWLWSFGAESFGQSYVDTVRHNVTSARGLRAHQVQAGAATQPLQDRVLLDWSGRRAHHSKYVVVQTQHGLSAFVGGIDVLISRDSYVNGSDHPSEWHDAAVEVTGGAAAEVWGDFRTRWRECAQLPDKVLRTATGTEKFNPAIASAPPAPPASPSADPAVPATIAPPPTAAVQVLRSYPTEREYYPWNHYYVPGHRPNVGWTHVPVGGLQEIRTVLVKALAAAKTFIYVEDQMVNDDLMATHHILLPHVFAAAAKGVKVIFVTTGEQDRIQQNLTLESVLAAHVAKLPAAERLNFALFRVKKLIVHSKIVLVDDEFMSIGSANFFDQSMTGHDTEVSVAAVDTTPFVRDLRVKLWAEHLRVDPAADPAMKARLEDVNQALNMWRPTWGTAGSFTSLGPVLELVGPK